MRKTCSTCDETKPVDCFQKRKRSIDGYRGQCKSCRYSQAKERNSDDQGHCLNCGANNWYEIGRCKPCSRKRARKYARKWRKKNPERHRRNMKRWYEENREYALEKMREWHEENKEHANRRRRKWHHENKEHVRKQHRRWQRNNRKKIAAAKARRRAAKAEADGDFTAEEFKAMCERYDHKCLCCGRSEPEIKLTPDHVIPLSWEGSTNNIENIQPLCIECNSAKKDYHATDYRKEITNDSG